MAYEQIVGEKEVSTKTGIIVVVFSFLALLLLSTLFSILSSLGVSPLVTSVGFWLSGGAVAVFVFNRFVIRYFYSIDGAKLVLYRMFSKRPRFMEQILLRELVFVGDKAEAQKKYAGLKIKNATRKTNPLPPVCIVFKRSGEVKGIMMQPNEEILNALREAVKK